MRIEVQRDTFLAPLHSAACVAEEGLTLEVLGNIHLEAGTDNQVTLKGTDMQIEATAIANATVLRKGTATINARKLAGIISALVPNEPIAIAVQHGHATLVQGASRYKVKTIATTEYPADQFQKDESTNPAVRIPARTLAWILEHVVDVACKDLSKSEIASVHLEIGSGRCVAVATDGSRMHVAYGETLEAAESLAINLPVKAARTVISSLSKQDGEASVAQRKNYTLVCAGAQEVAVMPVAKTYPKWNDILGKAREQPVACTIDRAEFLDALRRAAVLTSDKRPSLRLKINADREELTITGKAEAGQATEKVIVHDAKGPHDISFNPKYLVEAVEAIDSKRIEIRMGASDAAILVRADQEETPPGRPKSAAVVMPMRT
jgi:DNA polymerase-3 subunit beta